MFKHAAKILIRTLLSVVVLGVVVIGILIGAVSNGPVSLSFLTPYLTEILAEQYPEIALDFEELDMLWDGKDKNMVFAVTNLSVDRNNEAVAFVPKVTVTFSRAALLERRIAPSGLEFEGLKLKLLRSEEGQMQLGYAYEASEADAATEVASNADTETIHRLLAELGQRQSGLDLTAYLQRLEIYRSSLYIEDLKLNRSWQINSADMVIWSTDEGVNGQITGQVNLGGETISITSNTIYDRGLRTTTLSTEITDFPVNLLASEIPDLEILKGVDLGVSGNLNLSIDDEFNPTKISFNLDVGEGIIDIPSLYKEPLPIKGAQFEGHSMAPFTGVNINRGLIATMGPEVTLAGSVQNGADGFGMSLEGSLEELQVNNLGKYWPYSAAVDGYNWVTTRIRDGVARNAKFVVDFAPGVLESGVIPDEAVRLEFDLEGASTNYFPPLPKVTNISGSAILTATKIHVFDMTGELEDMTVSSGDALIYDFDKDTQYADITVTVEGKNKSIFGFLDRKPLELVRDYNIDPDQMTGVGTVTAQFVFPLLDSLLINQVQYEAKGQFADAFITDVYGDLDVSHGDFAAQVNPKKLTVKGRGDLAEIPADISFVAWLSGKQKGIRRYEVQASVDDEQRAKLDLLNTDYLAGSVGVSLAVDVRENGDASGLVTMNLLESEINVPELRYQKPLGVTGHMGAQFEAKANGMSTLSNIRLVSEGLEVAGNAQLDDKGLVEFSANKLAFGNNYLALQVIRNAPENYTANLRGRYFDAQPFVVENYSLNEGKAEVKEEEDALQVLLNLSLETVQLDGDVSIQNANGYVDYAGGLIRQGELNGTLNGKHKLKFAMNQSIKGRHLEFTTDHAGLLLKGLDIYDNAREGNLLIKADIDDTQAESVAKGWVDVKDLRIVKAPVLGRILTVGSLGGIVELLQNEGMTFATVEGPFTYTDGLIETKDFRAVGSIGITASGKVNQKDGTLDIFGTVIPSYTLNSILGNIPILGRLLVGREGEGIFGFSYKVDGKTEDPNVFVNPVSALAPGILRRMFFEPWGDGSEKKDGEEYTYPGTEKASP